MKEEISLKKTARLAGLFWVLSAVTAGFSLVYVRPQLIAFADATATANNILANESLFRMAIASTLFSQVFLLFFGLMAFRLFKGLSKTWANLFLTSIMMSVAIAVVNTLNNIAALVVLSKAEYLNVFGQEQLNAIMMIFLRVNNFGQGLLEIFWMPYLFALGFLIIKSKFMPRILGILLIIGSFGYPINAFAKILFPQSPAIISQLTMFGGSLLIPTILWLLIKGVKEQPQISES